MNSPSADRPASSIDPKLLEILVCPLTKSVLEYDAEKQALLEAPDLKSRAEILIAVTEMELAKKTAGGGGETSLQ